jgi:5-methylcytosine-specific restriction endonuclease McrA
MRTFICKNCNKENSWKHSTTNTYCDNKCQQEYQRTTNVQKWLSGENIKADRVTFRSYLSERKGYFCDVCKITDWNGVAIMLQVDHIDGNAGNNTFDNLRLLCPNCHSQQDNWGGRNRGNGRAARGLPLR